MYRCKRCDKVSRPYEKQYTLTVKERKVEYNIAVVAKSRSKKYRVAYKTPEELDALKAQGLKILKTYTTKGKEIVEEIKVCATCKQIEETRRRLLNDKRPSN